jgi:hypothetical protein
MKEIVSERYGACDAGEQAPTATHMEWFVKAFIRASLAWFALGIVLGLAMAVHPIWVIYRPAHAHMNVVGFLTLMVSASVITSKAAAFVLRRPARYTSGPAASVKIQPPQRGNR